MNYLIVLIVIGLLNNLSAVKGDPDDGDISRIKGSDERDDSLGRNEEGSLWEKLNSGRSPSDRRSIYSSPDINLESDENEKAKFTLKEFLEYFSRKHTKTPVVYDSVDVLPHTLDKLADDEGKRVNDEDKSKSWSLMDIQKHKHPFEDKKGWVSLEPIPWSVSKISKWQSKYKPSSERPWDDYDSGTSSRPHLHNDDFKHKRPVSITPPSPYVYHPPTETSDRFDNYYEDSVKPGSYLTSLNVYSRPTATYGHKVHVETHFPSSPYSSTTRPYYHNDKDCRHPNHPYDDIITDGMPSNFPQSSSYEAMRRKGSEMEIHPETHPFAGDGDWILLSTTKGYKPPRSGRQRSLNLGTTSESSQALTTTKGVKLTVLPPLKGSKVNMTTSHGGLLQVESTFDSVEQAKQKFDQKQNSIKIKTKKRRKVAKKKIPQLLDQSQTTIATVPRVNADPSAIMAAVGAGIIPATMAMMVPIAMSGS
ncbi:uncharacterized protein LOC115878099 isoform X1 [Sitophilus oryzae]|uniref:Uncharacterized protein LOC115878099 isoform X1 n=1 Tax=Sitophilus oryzae TaxID=7048 RepID=A0A6J2XI06_SITOR|nr:uncharacterized protein LOC115878099 isoform X1 [Sitophilus oryzae]